MTQLRHGRQPLLVAGIVALICLCGMVAVSPRLLVFDEIYHIEGARLLSGGASMHELLTTPLHSAPGPLYPSVHALLRPLTGLEAPAIRYVNLLLLLLSIGGVSFCLRLLAAEHPWQLPAMMLSVPMVWVTGGIALTQAPALAMATMSLAAAVWATTQPNGKPWLCYAGFIISGLFGGLAILGRQTYLPIICAFAVVAFSEKRWREPALVALLVACAIPLPVFITWGGLVPRTLAHVGGGIVVGHGLLAFAYLAFVVGIIAPRFFAPGWRWSLAAACATLLANITLFRFEWRAAAGLAKRLPPFLDHYYTIIVGSIGVAVLGGFLTATAINLWTRRQDKLFVLSLGQTLLLTATAFGVVHSFSSTYIMAAFPFIMLSAQPFFRPSKWAAVRLLAGGALGAASLSSYYWPVS